MNGGLVDKEIENVPENIADVTVGVTVIPCGEPAQPEPPKPDGGVAVVLGVVVALMEIGLAYITLATANRFAGLPMPGTLPEMLLAACGVAAALELGRIAFRPYDF